MSAIPDSVLNWLYSQLTSSYSDANRTYSDIVECLSSYRSLRPKTEVYTFENGQSALFVNISGTIPVQFRGVVYRFPITIWVPYAYPREAPMVYVTPSQDMVVTPGQHVSGDGRVYHPYLAQWGQYWDKSSISDLISVLRSVFAKEPPVRSKQQAQFASPQAAQSAPPPVPPPPEELRISSQQSPTPTLTPTSNGPPQPPPKPPKPFSSTGSPGPISAPPPPPKPYHPPQQDYTQQRRSWHQVQPPPVTPHQPQNSLAPQRQLSLNQPPRPQIQPQYNRQGQFSSPVSPITPISGPRGSVPQFHNQQPFQPQVQSGLRQSQQPSYNGATHQPQAQYHQPGPPHHQQYLSQPQQQPPKPKQPIPDLLDAPLDVTLPTQDPSHTLLPAPPIPPNPEKDALLRALSAALTSRISSTVSANTTTLPALRSQQTALRQAHSTLQSELQDLQQLDATLAANENIIRNAMRTADRVMDEAQQRKVPDVDEVLVAPTVVGGQLYNLCAEERAVGDALFVLGRGLDRGRVGADVFVKQTRSLAREQFLKKALIKKIARGMGLETMYEYGH